MPEFEDLKSNILSGVSQALTKVPSGRMSTLKSLPVPESEMPSYNWPNKDIFWILFPLSFDHKVVANVLTR